MELQRAIERWVEDGDAPNLLLAKRVKGGVNNESFSRPLCPYPEVARYNGTGAADDAASFSCVAPAK